MPFAEVIYEPGSKSVVSYDDLNELKAGLTEHHNRAKSGDLGGPAGGPAERVTKVYLYDDHPADLHAVDNKVDSSAVSALVSGMSDKDGKLDAFQLIAALRDEISPVFPQSQGRHESMYKGEGEPLALDFLDGSGDSNV